MPLPVLSLACLVWWSVSVTLCGMSLLGGLVQPRAQARRATRRDQPPVSAILPVKALDQGFRRAQESIFAQDYPSYEVLFGAAEKDSPAVAAARQVTRRHPERPSRIVHSPGIGAVSPKLDVLATPLAEARHDFVLTKDSNITLDPGAMAAMMRCFTAKVGLVVAVPVAVRPGNLAGRVEACLINGHARLLLASAMIGLGFGVGKAMLFRRSDLERIGGVTALSHMLAEDTALARMLARHGLTTVYAHETVAQEIGARSFREIFDRQVRWCVIRQSNETFSFPLEPLVSPLPASVAAALAAPLVGLPGWNGFAGTLLAWYCAELGFAKLKGWELSACTPLGFLGREILALASWLRAWTTHEVVWAESRFDARTGPGGIKRTL
jgi:ceramide glucosyltransferase